MSRDEKQVKKFLLKKNITIDDCDRVLILHGYELHKSHGSHRVYHKKGAMPITVVVPKGTKYLKTPYVNEIIKALKLED